VSPTAEADWLYSESRFLSEGLQSLSGRITGLRGGAEQRLSAACVGLMMHSQMPRALARLREEMPGLAISISSRTALEQLSGLRAGQLDVGYCGGMVEGADLYRRAIGRGRLVVLVPDGHALQDRTAIDPAELPELPGQIRMPMDRPIGRLLAPFIADPTPEPGQITCYSLEAMTALAQHLGLAAVVDNLTAASLRASTLRTVPFDPPITFDFHAFAARPFARRRAALILTDMMEAILSEVP
jgi:DNA-binding transcriptional LysR family regulator